MGLMERGVGSRQLESWRKLTVFCRDHHDDREDEVKEVRQDGGENIII